VDVADHRQVSGFCRGRRIDWIVNCAAYTAVDRAEEEPGRARAVNALGAENVARAAGRAGAGLVHISTDYVFDGAGREPYLETDPPNPLGVYGKTKLEGEELVRAACGRHLLIRTSWLFGRHGKSFVSAMLGLFRRGGEVRVVDDQRGCPTCTLDLARAVAVVVERAAASGDLSGAVPWGIFHFCSPPAVTWYGFAGEILSQAVRLGLVGARPTLVPVSSGEFASRAARPKSSVLDTGKFRTAFGYAIRSWPEALREHLGALQTSGEGGMP
jgi:dTDP-4-dehydrorhamnose reductase